MAVKKLSNVTSAQKQIFVHPLVGFESQADVSEKKIIYIII